MYGMFNGYSSLTSIDVTKFNTEKVTYMNGIFNDCKSLKSIDVSNININKFKGIVNENILKIK